MLVKKRTKNAEAKASNTPLAKAKRKHPIPPTPFRQSEAQGQWNKVRGNNIAEYKPSENGSAWNIAKTNLTNEIKVRHYSKNTLQTYCGWLTKFQAHAKNKNPTELTDEDFKNFLTFLAVNLKVAASTQNQAFNAILFFFRHVLKKEPGEIKSVRAKHKPYLPVVLTRKEINRVLGNLSDPYHIIVGLLYGCGLRLFESLQLRVQEFNFDDGMLTVHDGKGKKDRAVTILPGPPRTFPAPAMQIGPGTDRTQDEPT
ncbi:MAG: tyrosine-type recombinase/integrase [Chitinivibrionales bacterium]|nr:tyrosine-type recombinase/integrase [Chitinivibrionales bacterium]